MRFMTLAGLAFAAALSASPASAQTELKIIAPAAPGGGWDQTARSMQQALIAEKLVQERAGDQHRRRRRHRRPRAVRQQRKGDGNQLMVNGFVMVGAILMNKSPVTLDQVTPIAQPDRRDAGHRRAGEFADQERQGPRRGGEEGRRAR